MTHFTLNSFDYCTHFSHRHLHTYRNFHLFLIQKEKCFCCLAKISRFSIRIWSATIAGRGLTEKQEWTFLPDKNGRKKLINNPIFLSMLNILLSNHVNLKISVASKISTKRSCRIQHRFCLFKLQLYVTAD